MSNGDEYMNLDVRIDLYGQNGTRVGINESVRIEHMTFDQMARLLSAFHVIAEAIKEGRNVNLNGQEVRYFG